jgi:hypothetical protein
MLKRYVAYGLELRSFFDLPGMPPAASSELPGLTCRLVRPAQLERAWSGCCSQPAWKGRLGDGRQLTVLRGRVGDLLFRYSDLACFRLHPSQELLDCAPRREGRDWQRILLSKVLCDISVARGNEALHAGAVDSPDGVVAFAGPSGAGKSTLVAEFLRRGWPLFTDDVFTFRRDADRLRGYPGTPHMNLVQGSHESGERWLVADSASRAPRPVRMICLLKRARGQALEARVLPANPLQLAPYMLGFRGEQERQRERFHLYADLVRRATLVSLTGDLDDPPEAFADAVEELLAGDQALAGRAG